MKINCDDFRVFEDEKVGFAMWPTTVKPLYKSRKHYRALMEAHIAELTVQQSLLIAFARLVLRVLANVARAEVRLRRRLHDARRLGLRVAAVTLVTSKS